MRFITILILPLIFYSCNDPKVDPSSFQEIYFEEKDVALSVPDVTNASYDVQILLNTRQNGERIILIVKGNGEINQSVTNLTVDINAEISALTLNTDFSYSLIIDEATPINTLVNCDNNNPHSHIDELSSFIESKKLFQWDDDQQLYYIDLAMFNGLLPEVDLPSKIIYQSNGVLNRSCD